MSNISRRVVRILGVLALSMCLVVLPEGCAHSQPKESEVAHSQDASKEDKRPASEPLLKRVRHLGHVHLPQRTSTTTKGK